MMCRNRAMGERGSQPSQDHLNEPADRGPGRKASGCCECVETVAGQFRGSDFVPEVAAFGSFCQKVTDEVVKLLLGSGDVRSTVKRGRELTVMVLVRNEREGVQHRFEPFAGAAGVISGRVR